MDGQSITSSIPYPAYLEHATANTTIIPLYFSLDHIARFLSTKATSERRAPASTTARKMKRRPHAAWLCKTWPAAGGWLPARPDRTCSPAGAASCLCWKETGVLKISNRRLLPKGPCQLHEQNDLRSNLAVDPAHLTRCPSPRDAISETISKPPIQIRPTLKSVPNDWQDDTPIFEP